jgi:carboxylate-amine ligase
MRVRKVGIEEELLLVDPGTGEMCNLSRSVLHQHRSGAGPDPASLPADGPADLDGELLLHMVETHTDPGLDLADLGDQVRAARRTAVASAEAAGVAVAAVGFPPLGWHPRVAPDSRYERIVREFGETGLAAGTLGMHLHVDVEDDEEAVRVIDRVRPWLPVLVALAANSPFADGRDTGYASWRQQVWSRWPSAGPAEPFGSVAEYRRVTEAMIASGAALDAGMLYLDARPAESYPTVEIRVADVCTDVEDALLVAALARALVSTAAPAGAADADGAPPRSDLLRGAHWRAARDGVTGGLVHPVSGTLVPAREAVSALVERVRPALRAAGDEQHVATALDRLATRGAGARQQRQARERTGGVDGVVADLVARTAASAAAEDASAAS